MRTRWRKRWALAAAVGVHGALLWLHDVDDARVKPKVEWQIDDDSAPLQVTLLKPPPKPTPDEPPEAPTTTTAPVPAAPPVAAADPPDDADDAPADAPADAPTSTSPEPAPSDPAPDLAPRTIGSGKLIEDVVVGVDARGPRPSTRALGEALDYQPDSERDKRLSGGALAVARANRSLRRDLAFHDVTVGLGDDWFRSIKDAAERGFRPTPSDLDNPAEVTREAILANYLRDPTSWDDDARAALEPLLQADRLASKNPIERLALGNSANLGQAADTMLRRSTVDDLLRRKDAGLAVRFAFEVDVHHAADGAITAIDVLRNEYERSLVEKVRMAVEGALLDVDAVPDRVARGLPFRSRWLFVATWYLDPPRPRLTSSNSMFTSDDGAPALMLGGTFDVTKEGVKSSSLDVKMKTTAELLDVTPLR